MTIRRGANGLALLLPALIATGCGGLEGPSGVDAEGVDVTPPTVQMTQPWPLGTYWDRLPLTAAAADNVAVDRVVFTLDGSPIAGGVTMVVLVAPYRLQLPLAYVEPGWHLAAARAYDIAGNVTDAPPRPVWLGQSPMLSDTVVTLSYHNGVAEQRFTIPDTARGEAFWVRFTPAKEGSLRRAVMHLGGVFSDTAYVRIAVWTGIAVPARAETTMTVPAVILADDALQLQTFNFGENGFRVRSEFFIVVDLIRTNPSDTLRLAADDGSPPWGRSGSRDDAGWHSLGERYGSTANLLAACDIYYAFVQPDTTD